MSIDPGRLRHYVTVEKPAAEVPDGDGGYTQEFGAIDPPAEMYMSIEAADQKIVERLFAGTTVVQGLLIFRGRWHSDLDETCRLSWTDRAGRTHTANVTSVNDVGQEGVEIAVLAVETT